MRRLPSFVFTAAVAAALAACTRGARRCRRDSAAADAAATVPARATETAPATRREPRPMNRSASRTLAVYERGLAAEVAAYRAALANVQKARSASDSSLALLAMMRAAMGDSAARAAGVSRARYRRLDDVFGGAISRSIMNPAMAKTMGEGDTSHIASLPPEAQQRMRDNMAEMRALGSDSAIYDGVPEPLRADLKQGIAGRLGQLWRERLEISRQGHRA
jgi:hypothetical protein